MIYTDREELSFRGLVVELDFVYTHTPLGKPLGFGMVKCPLHRETLGSGELLCTLAIEVL